MSVWLCMPSKRPPEEVSPVVDAWIERGYRVFLQRDLGDPGISTCGCVHRPYSGYPDACNWLILYVSQVFTDTQWFVLAGDDTLPDPVKSADDIARECTEHFAGTFGVMQPTGDRWADSQGVCIERIAGSPWIGSEFARRINGGRGPIWPEYWHMGNDEELQNVAIKYGVFWQRSDITHMHNHWGRPRPGEKMGLASRMPKFLERANSREEWANYKRVFLVRKAAGFLGSEPIP